MARIPIALELFSVREQLKADPLGTLKAVAAMGYEGVEFAGPPQHEGPQLRDWLAEAGLVCCGWHTPWPLVQDDTLADTIALNQTIGNRFVIVPGIPEELRKTREDWLTLAGQFNDLGAKLADHDMQTGYHNHHVEFTELDGEKPWDTFFGHTDDRVVMQLDTGNAAAGGGDCVDILQRYPGRATTVHLKPYHVEQRFRPVIGEDSTPWQDVFALCETTGGTQWYIVEYESDAYPPLEAVERCLRALKAMGK